MTNRAALLIFLGIAAILAALFLTVDDAPVFIARKFSNLIEWIAFWR